MQDRQVDRAMMAFWSALVSRLNDLPISRLSEPYREFGSGESMP
jgi:hypothetical protein